ncbi:MAG: prenyltransferase/squalene oxidase repeat-containing protein [Mycobacteriales bacterium]
MARIRLLTAGLAAGLAAGLLALAAAVPARAAGPLPAGLFGAQDPSRGGVARQALAITALRTAGVLAGTRSYDWLRDQQCADGGFPTYREPGRPCDPAGEDIVATALAVQAITAAPAVRTASDQPERVGRAVAWLRARQRPDGGWPAAPGGTASDPRATAYAVTGMLAAKADPGRAYAYLRGVQVGCDGPAAERGSVHGDGDTTAVAVLALGRQLLPADPAKHVAAHPVRCAREPAQAAQAGAAYLAATLRAHGNLLAGDDLEQTCWAIMALAAAKVDRAEADEASVTMIDRMRRWVRDSAGRDLPEALADLILVNHAVGRDPKAYGGVDLVRRLRDTEQGGVTSRDLVSDRQPKPHTDPGLVGLAAAGLAAVGAAAVVPYTRRRRRSP